MVFKSKSVVLNDLLDFSVLKSKSKLLIYFTPYFVSNVSYYCSCNLGRIF